MDQKALAPRGALSAISSAKSKLIGVEGFGLGMKSYMDELVHRVYERYEDLLSQASAVDFDDLLLKTHDLLRRFPDVAENYQERYLHLMIDEFQDTNVAQYAIARLLAPEAPEPVRRRRPRPVDLLLAQRRHRQHPQLPQGLSREPRDRAGGELQVHPDHTRRRPGGDSRQS